MKVQQSHWVLLFTLLFSRALAYGVEKREIPNFEGRESRAVTTGEALLRVPQVIFFPVYIVTEYGFRAPLRWLGREAELNNVPFLVADFFKFGDDNRFAVYPSVLVDFGFRASLGFRFRWKDFLGEKSRLNLRAASGGTDYGILQLSNEWQVADDSVFKLLGEVSRRPDYIFHSMGSMSSKDTRYRYTAIKKEVGFGFEKEKLWGGTVGYENSFRFVEFRNSDCCGDPGLDRGIQDGVFPPPTRYLGGYSAFSQKVVGNWGRRVSRPKERAGGIVDTFVQHAFDFSGGEWWGYGGALTGFVDLTGHARVLSLKVDTEFSNGANGKEVPFNELPSIGGERLSGFLDRRFIGESSFVVTTEYKWPVVSKLDGTLHFALGNVFGTGLQNLQWGWLRKSIGVGIEATGGRSTPFRILLAAGSAPFDLGGEFNEIRFSLKFGGGL